MKVYQSSFNYDYPFPTVTLAYFLRYPNPYSRHVLSTDVIDRYVDPDTNRLHTVRLVLKKSKVPAPILKLLPRGLAGPNGNSQTYVLEKSIVDIKEGWMSTESTNMEYTGVLSVVERQHFKRRSTPGEAGDESPADDRTNCKTTVTCISRLGQAKAARRKAEGNATNEADPPKQGFFAALSTAGLQRTVELVGVERTKRALPHAKEGMNVVLERLRSGGVLAVLESMRRDRMEMGGDASVWRKPSDDGD
jgi:4-amino-4-deoxychorismate lyase